MKQIKKRVIIASNHLEHTKNYKATNIQYCVYNSDLLIISSVITLPPDQDI
jgi:hypothetical protein